MNTPNQNSSNTKRNTTIHQAIPKNILFTETLYEIMQIGRWKPQTKQLGPEGLEAYIPVPSNRSSTHALKTLLIFRGYLKLRCFQLLSSSA